jgi:hypothetical protein
MTSQILNKKSQITANYPEPMTWDESFEYIENLESNKFSYEEWEIARDLNFMQDLDELIKNCDPRLNK